MRSRSLTGKRSVIGRNDPLRARAEKRLGVLRGPDVSHRLDAALSAYGVAKDLDRVRRFLKIVAYEYLHARKLISSYDEREPRRLLHPEPVRTEHRSNSVSAAELRERPEPFVERAGIAGSVSGKIHCGADVRFVLQRWRCQAFALFLSLLFSQKMTKYLTRGNRRVRILD